MSTAEDDERLGLLFRLLRLQSGLTQEELALGLGIPLRTFHLLENGHAGQITYERLRRMFGHFDARARMSVWWNGAAADRLLDERHAELVERGSRIVARYGWDVPTEVTFSRYGERGSIDIFGHRRDLAAVVVTEVKSAIGSLEELNRTLDAKVRLAPDVCQERFGWRPSVVGRLLIVPDVSSTRRVVAKHRMTMDELYPARARELRDWLRKPVGNIGGIWFLSNPRQTQAEPSAEP